MKEKSLAEINASLFPDSHLLIVNTAETLPLQSCTFQRYNLNKANLKFVLLERQLQNVSF